MPKHLIVNYMTKCHNKFCKYDILSNVENEI